jgi:hypothetical protein
MTKKLVTFAISCLIAGVLGFSFAMMGTGLNNAMAGQGVPGFIRMSECLILALVPLTLWLMFTDKLRCLIAGILLLLGTGSLLEMNGGAAVDLFVRVRMRLNQRRLIRAGICSLCKGSDRGTVWRRS